MLKINDYIDNPNLFVRDLNKSIDLYIKSKEEVRSEEWKARNAGSTISGSIFSQCIRKAWYSYFTLPSDGEFSLESRKKMYLGYINEEILLEALKFDPGNIDVTIHYEQNVSPVNQVIQVDGVNLSTTTDFVLEYPGGIYVPIEAKSTEAPDFQPAGKWWEKFSGYDSHRRQLAQWMFYAQKNGLNVPFGVLFYTRRANYASKDVIIMNSEEVPFSPTGDTTIELYSEWESVIESRVAELTVSINEKKIPSFPNDVPAWMCKGCFFREDCHDNK